MCRGIVRADRPVPAFADNLTTRHEYCTHRHLTLSLCQSGQFQRPPHVVLISRRNAWVPRAPPSTYFHSIANEPFLDLNINGLLIGVGDNTMKNTMLRKSFQILEKIAD
jgi:hypothetical protein